MELRSEGNKRNMMIISEAMQENKGEGENEMMVKADRISLLPEPILHNIMAMLPTRYAARTSVLSQKWNFLWSTFPVINLSEHYFVDPGRKMKNREVLRECRERFIHYMQLTLSRRWLINLDHFKIHTFIHGNNKMYQVVDRLIEAAMKGKLKELDLKFDIYDHFINNEEREREGGYELPEVIFSFGQSLLSLRVEGCKFLDSSKNLEVNFHLLKTLFIVNAHIDGAFLESVIRGCHAIESLFLEKCEGLKSFRISHSRMRQFVLKNCRQLEEFKIDAPNLQSFKYKGYGFLNENGVIDMSGFNPSSDALRFSNLNKLTLSWVSMKADIFDCIISSFPYLKFMKMTKCNVSERSHVLSNNLTNVVMQHCFFDEKLDLRAENLQALTFVNSYNCVNVISTNSFKYLSSLSFISICELTGNDLRFAVSSCNHLRSLVLKSCCNLEDIKILSGTLEYLVISYCVNVNEVRILAHKLMYLEYMGPILKFSRLLSSNKLVAKLHLNCYHPNIEDLEQFQIKEFLQMFSRCVESMTLLTHCDECMKKLKTSSEPPPLSYLNVLKIRTNLIGEMNLVNLLQSMLRISVCRKSMCIDLENSSSTELEFQGFSREEMLDQHNSVTIHNCVKDHLIEARMSNFAGDLEELMLIKFLVNRAAHLRKILISIKENSDLATETRYRSEVLAKINNLLKASPNAEIVFSLIQAKAA